ncbi:MAG: AraC-like DNA-binding protein [Cyclobacteriaceae bacterium]|jgi:AraC-like DNA-binding protein
MKIEQQKISGSNEIIQSAWMIKLEKEKVNDGYYLFPDNQAEIIIAMKGSFSRKIVGNRKQYMIAQGESILAKARSRGMVIQADEDITFLLIKLNPQYLNVFANHPYNKFRDEVQRLALPARFNQLWKNALFYKEKREVLSILETYIAELTEENQDSRDSMISETIEIIREQKGEIKIKELNDILGICKSTLEQKFNREVGMSPKEFCKIEKLSNFLKNYFEFCGEMTLTQLTFKSGYYDQSHLIKDFKYYVEDSPKRFLANANKVLLYAN